MGTGSDKPAVSRRRFLRGAAGLAGASILAACGGAAPSTGGGATSGPAAGGATSAPAQGGAAQVTIEWWDTQTGVDEEVTKKMIAPVTTPQIYWGAIPFLCIQLMMVGLIIAFPGIVSSGLDKEEVYDLDKVRMEMEAAMPDAAPEAADPTAGMDGASAPASDAAPAADDPLKALQDSMANEKK